ncbi:hypothetical protein RI054_15g72360 [Pseudoscourfieldia marina]
MDPMAAEGLTDVPSRFKAVVEQLEEVGFYNIERDIKLENLEEIDEETWVQYYSVPDRRYIYTAVKATLSQAANDAYENEKKNGILLLHRLWKLHGAPNLANTISALTELLNIETTMHQDPAPNLQSPERILTEFFPGTPDNMKIALLMRTVNTDKYRSILDSMKIPGMVIPTYLELKQAVQNHYATDRAEHEQKMKGGKRKAQQEENRTPKPKISPHAALATAVAAEVRRPSRKTRQRSLRMKGFLNSSVHNCNNRGQITIEHTTDCPNPRPGGGRGRGGRGAAGGRGRGYGRGYTRLKIALNSLEGLRARIDLKRDNLHNHLTKSSVARALAANGRDVSLSRLELYDNRGNTYPIKITTPPYDKKAGGVHERIIDTLDACHGHIIRETARAAQIPPIVLKTVAIIYNNMTHGATDKIPSIELFRSRRRSLALRIIGDLIYVYDTSADIAFSPSNSPRVPTTPSRASTPHRFRTAASVEGGGGDGLDEVDKFIHDALNQAPPTEGGASPIEGGGEPDLGALGIHGHANDGQRPDCEAVFDANKTLKITLVIPDLESVTVDRRNTSSRFRQEKRYTVTQMASHAARRDGMSRFTDSADPHMTDLLPPSSAGTLV